MTIRQISVFVENKPGAMVSITQALGKAGVDLRALSLADTQDFGILRMIVDDTDKAKQALAAIGCFTTVSDVLAAEIPDTPGAMTELIGKVAETGLNIEYTYAFISPVNRKAYIVLRIKDIDGAAKALKAKGIVLADEVNSI